MQRAVQVPSALIDTMLGLVVLFVVGSQWWAHKRAAQRVVATTEEEAAP
jgi:simple sugar transport system permease protein